VSSTTVARVTCFGRHSPGDNWGVRILFPQLCCEPLQETTSGGGNKSHRLELPYLAVADEYTSAGSFEELAMPLFARLYNFAHWLTQDRAEAEDLVQETYMKALKGFASFQQGTNFRAWMYKILRNTFLTSRTGLKTSMTVSLDDEEEPVVEPATAATPESVLLVHMDRQAIENALEQLPVKFREIILLCDVEEMSYQEIASTLAIPIGTVMSRLSRARKAMRELLATRVRGTSR
jgi:RNA polymerase sigma-70 factor, ECF subfamily